MAQFEAYRAFASIAEAAGVVGAGAVAGGVVTGGVVVVAGAVAGVVVVGVVAAGPPQETNNSPIVITVTNRTNLRIFPSFMNI